ncbi:MAG: cytochrome c biogenesis protein ResB, partial [Saprospiraceae bacterium]
MKFLKKVANRLFSTSAAGLYIILFAVAIGVATFIENDFGTSSAQKVIFKSKWFELLLLLFCITLIVNIFRFRMAQQKKWAILTFHASMVVIIIGAGVTRYFGSEGMMGIREGSASNSFLSAESYLLFQVMHQGKKYAFDEPVLFATLGDNSLKKEYAIGNQIMTVEVTDFVPNPAEVMVDDEKGVPILKVVIAGMSGREEYPIKYGDKVNIYGTLFNFGVQEDPQAFNIKYQNDSLYFIAGQPYSEMVMATQTSDTLAPGAYHPLKLRSMYSDGRRGFVFGMFTPNGRTEITSTSPKMASTSPGGLHMKIGFGGEEKEVFVIGSQGVEGAPRVAPFGNSSVGVAYGAKRVELPFSIQLKDFIMERYPGTNSASSYASEVTLLDRRNNLVRDQRIFMNNILNYGGYRFFQSSFDQDELGTYLSVNHDAPGTLISYIGYALLTLGMILTLFSKNTRFAQLSRNIKEMRKKEKLLAALIMGFFWSFSTPVQANIPGAQAINKAHAAEFGEIMMQDSRGRIKPMNTFCSEVLR